MEIKIISETENSLLKRKEVVFQAEHSQTGSTPPRAEVRAAIAKALRKDLEVVFIKRMETKTGTKTAVGIAHVYDSIDYAKLIEPEYIVKRNMPTEKQEKKEGETKNV
ncbi:MAG: 30S ribosomal protein S24e [Nitrososphaerota archaeon]|nr:30S ribosomal protein S24e [Candidatus Bathyarchaeota archaeon]MDW8023831.1 30S ribosomal protein S24e [Nitrososphaerota archaeon]